MLLKIPQNSQENKFRQWCFPKSFAKFLRTRCLQNTTDGCFWKQLSDASITEAYWRPVKQYWSNCFPKKLHRRCLTGSYIRLIISKYYLNWCSGNFNEFCGKRLWQSLILVVWRHTTYRLQHCKLFGGAFNSNKFRNCIWVKWYQSFPIVRTVILDM